MADKVFTADLLPNAANTECFICKAEFKTIIICIDGKLVCNNPRCENALYEWIEKNTDKCRPRENLKTAPLPQPKSLVDNKPLKLALITTESGSSGPSGN